jgi:hypothetical protein
MRSAPRVLSGLKGSVGTAEDEPAGSNILRKQQTRTRTHSELINGRQGPGSSGRGGGFHLLWRTLRVGG